MLPGKLHQHATRPYWPASARWCSIAKAFGRRRHEGQLLCHWSARAPASEIQRRILASRVLDLRSHSIVGAEADAQDQVVVGINPASLGELVEQRGTALTLADTKAPRVRTNRRRQKLAGLGARPKACRDNRTARRPQVRVPEM